jgi:hypothetical protein
MFTDNKNFYPTPTKLIRDMLSKVDFNNVSSVLEPSAGKGNIVESVIDKFKYSHSYSYNKNSNWDIDCIEIDENLQHILKGKNFRIVHNDFLSYNSYKKYDLIAMNPPFDNGEKHLLKAIEMQINGGQIVCLLNAETIKNPYNNQRKDLQRKLEELNATIDFIENAFEDAERKTFVEVALVYINIPKLENNSIILDELKKEEQHREEPIYNNTNIINADFIKGIVEQYNFEIKAGLKFIAEYDVLKTSMFKNFEITIICNKENDKELGIHNSYINDVRSKYWKALFENDKFMGLFTSNLRNEYLNKVKELCNYDFSLYNIYTIKLQLNKHMIKGVEDTIMNLFEEFSHKHHWYDEMSKNIHLFNGWKTNKAFKINKKIIIPLNGFRDLQYSWGRYEPTRYEVINKLTDIEKVLNYLDGGLTEDIGIEETLKMAEHYEETKKIQLKYYMVTFFKKGTCHIEFTNEKLLHKFNLFGSQKKNWIPPSYGKKKYKDMTQEEKQVVNEFEGETSYNEVMKNTDYYIFETSKLLMLA